MIKFPILAGRRVVSDKPLTFGCDLDLCRANLHFVRDTPSHFPYFSVKWEFFYSYNRHTVCNGRMDSRPPGAILKCHPEYLLRLININIVIQQVASATTVNKNMS